MSVSVRMCRCLSRVRVVDVVVGVDVAIASVCRDCDAFGNE